MQCPFCKETIIDGALKCKHCGSMLTDDKKPGGMEKWQAIVLAILLFVCAAVTGLINEYFPYLLVIITAIWASFDASKLKTKDYQTAASPVSVLLGGLLLWVVIMPWYLYVRSNIKAGNYPRRVNNVSSEQTTNEGDIPGFIGNNK